MDFEIASETNCDEECSPADALTNEIAQMRSSFLNHRAIVFATLLAVMFAAAFVLPRAHAQNKLLPKRTGHINDFAEVIDGPTKERLEAVLEKLKEKTKFDFVIATVKSTGGEDLYDYSLAVANDWNVGAPASSDKSLLIVIAADNGKSFSQVTRGARLYLPEGLVGEIGQRMRDKVASGGYGSGLTAAVRTFVDRVGEKNSFDFAALDPQRGETLIAEQKRPRTVQSPLAEASESPSALPSRTPPAAAVSATPTESPSPEASVSPLVVATAQPTSTPPAEPAATPAATETPTPTATPAETVPPQPSPSASTQPVTKGSPQSLKTPSTDRKATASPLSPEDEKEQVELTLTLKLGERIDALKAFIAAHPTSVAVPRANELLVVAHAMFGEQKLQANDVDGGLQQFRLAISEAPADLPDRLFTDVIARMPLNLFLRGQRDAAFDIAHQAESLAKTNAKRLVALAQFYLAIESAGEATRIAEAAVQVAPDSALAHQALGAARHISLRLDESESEYARALSLDPKSDVARYALADLKRANGKPEDALALYREQLRLEKEGKAARIALANSKRAAGKNDEALALERDQAQLDQHGSPARAGVILSLLESGKKDEADTELKAALQDKDESHNLPLLAGAAYWFMAHNDAARGLDLAQQATALEPRYSWSQIALARGLVANKQPLQAERGLRFARQFSRFPTLDYELASVLASVGLYDEAAQELARSFSSRNGEVETKLAGRNVAHAASFTELLAPERRAAIFQATPADSEANARMMKALLAFNAALDQASPKEDELTAIAQEFIKGDDAMRTYRQVYVASKFVKKGIALSSVVELMDQAMTGVEVALSAPAATVAVQPEELGDERARALTQGGTPDIPDAPRTALSGLLRGRIEDLAGLALFNLDKPADAAIRLRRAVTTATEGTPLWRSSMWHLGAALEANGKHDQALLYYIKSYVNGPPDPARRSIIETVYKKVNGTLDGLDDKIGPGFAAASASPSPTPSP
jgi:predicted Zn-dependent protease